MSIRALILRLCGCRCTEQGERLPESVIFNRLLHARDNARREAEWNYDRIATAHEHNTGAGQ